MSESEDIAIVVMTTCPDQPTAETVAAILVERKLAACVQINPSIKSVYMWESEIRNESETLLLIKTLSSKYPLLEKTIKENHPYKVPEILAVPASDVSDDYLKWMKEVV